MESMLSFVLGVRSMNMKLIYLLFLAYPFVAISGDQNFPPRHWWQEQATIEKIEKDDAVDVDSKLKRFSNISFKSSDSSNENVSEANSRIKRVKSSKSSKEMQEKFLETIKNNAIVNNSEWKILKSKFIEGDAIYGYAAPPLSGPYGYILVRNNAVIYDVVLGDQ